MTNSEPKSKPGQLTELRSFARTRTRGLTARQQDIVDRISQHVTINAALGDDQDPAVLFDTTLHDVWIEIGFGGGEHLLWQARHHPGIGLIGCEPFRDGVVRVMTAIDTEKLTNIRLLADDARPLLRSLQPASIGRAFVLFADPWPKKRHNKRRLINSSLADVLARVLKPGAELRIATDIDDYLKSILLTFHAHLSFQWLAERPADWRHRPDDWPETRYEAKAIREGRSCAYLRYRRI